MARNPAPGEPQKQKYSLRSGLVKEYSEDRYFRQNDQRDRWMAEHQHHEAVEKSLADVSKFSYEPEDYVSYLVKEPFIEPARTDFSHLLPERMKEAEQRYHRPINIRWILMAALIVSVAIFPSFVTLAIVVIMLAIVGFGQFKILKERQTVLERTEERTRQEIDAKTKAQEETIARLCRAHEQSETERVEFFVRLLNGEESAMISVLDQCFSKIRLPFPMDVDFDIYGGVILVKVWLPLKSVIPYERTSLTESGRIQYEKKESTEINKQYAELCAAILMQVSTVLYAKLPNIERVYIWGMSKESEKDECLISMQLSRMLVEKVANAQTALVALKGVSAGYSCDEFLKLLPVEVSVPSEWEGVEQKQIRSLHVKIFR